MACPHQWRSSQKRTRQPLQMNRLLQLQPETMTCSSARRGSRAHHSSTRNGSYSMERSQSSITQTRADHVSIIVCNRVRHIECPGSTSVQVDIRATQFAPTFQPTRAAHALLLGEKDAPRAGCNQQDPPQPVCTSGQTCNRIKGRRWPSNRWQPRAAQTMLSLLARSRASWSLAKRT